MRRGVGHLFVLSLDPPNADGGVDVPLTGEEGEFSEDGT